MRMSTRLSAGLVMLAAASAGIAALPATSALAGPTNAPNVTTGTADCGSAGMFTFVATGNSGQGTSWNPAFVMSSTGGRALFHPTTFNFTITTPQGTFSEVASKNKAPGPVSCTVASTPNPDFSLTGTVTGSLTWRG